MLYSVYLKWILKMVRIANIALTALIFELLICANPDISKADSVRQPQFIDGAAVIIGKEYKEFMGTWANDENGKLVRNIRSYKCKLYFVLKEDFKSYVYNYPSDGKIYTFEGYGNYFTGSCKLPIGTTGIITADRITKEVDSITKIKLP